MKKFRAILIYAIIIAITILFVLKAHVHTLNQKNLELTKSIIQEQDNLHILTAEFTHLSKPKRIEVFAKKYLTLQTIESTQLISVIIENNKVQIFDQVRY